MLSIPQNSSTPPIPQTIGHKHAKNSPISSRIHDLAKRMIPTAQSYIFPDPTRTPESQTAKCIMKRPRVEEEELEEKDPTISVIDEPSSDSQLEPTEEEMDFLPLPPTEPRTSPSLDQPKTPPQRAPSHIPPPGISPLATPVKRYELHRKSNGSWSAKKCFTPGTEEVLRQYEQEGRSVAYTVKGESDLESFRYAGGTQRPLQRTRQHASEANNPRGTSTLSQKERMLKGQPNARLSIGIVAVSAKPSYDEGLEERTRQKVQQAYTNVVNQRKGGGGGVAMQERPTISTSQASAAFQRHILIPYTTGSLRKVGGRITHSLSQEDLTQEKVIYIFERTMPSGVKKRLVGMTDPTFSKRLSTYLSHINNPEKSPRKKREFYQEAHEFWNQFTISVIPVQKLLDQGSTLGQIETIAIKVFGGLQGYNKNKGGGGGARRQ